MFGSSNKIICDLCNSSKHTIFKKRGPFTYYKCQKCQGVFVYPKKGQKFYLDTETYLSDPETYISAINPRGMTWLIGKYEEAYCRQLGSSRGKVLEIGAGVGFLAFMLFARDWDIEGMETSQPSADWAKKYLRMDIHTSTLEEFRTTEQYKAFILVEVLEHFVDATVAINQLKTFAAKPAMIFGTTPNTDSPFWDSGAADIYAPDDHIFLFNRRSMEYFAKTLGLKNLTVEYFGSGEDHDSNIMFSALL